MPSNLLVTLADRNYINQAKQLFSSVYWNAGWKGDYMLLAHEVPEEELRWFRDKGILVKECEPLYDKRLGEIKQSPVVLDKFYLFTPEFKRWKKVIYLDTDIIVRASLDRLVKVRGFAAAKSSLKLAEQFAKFNELYNEFEENYVMDKASFNTGIMVFSTAIIREGTLNNLIGFFNKYKDISRFVDEGILNLVYYDRWKRLPSLFSLDVSLLELRKLNYNGIRAVVLHFIKILNYKSSKPWHEDDPFYGEWKHNLDRAELIDLKNIPDGKRWSRLKICKYSLYFMIKYSSLSYEIRSFIKVIIILVKDCLAPKLKRGFLYLINTPERLIGKLGMFLKRRNPGLYYRLKSIGKKAAR